MTPTTEPTVMDLDTDPREFLIYGHHSDESARAAVARMVGDLLQSDVTRQWVRFTRCDAERCWCEGTGHIVRVERGTPGARRVTLVREPDYDDPRRADRETP